MDKEKDTKKNNEKVEKMKPLSVARAEFMDGIVDMVNNANLPMFVVEYILKDVLEEVHSVARKQYEKDKEEYYSSVN